MARTEHFDEFESFDYESDEVEVTEREAQTRSIPEVPASMVALAQKSWDGQKEMTLSFRGKDPQWVAQFAELLKSAGHYTKPQTSTLVTYKENSITVTFRSTERRGRKPGQTDPKANGAPKVSESTPDKAKATK